MPSTNGHGPKKAILYARVSTDEQARSGFSLAQQLEALREYAHREGYEVLEEVSDPGQSGASLERPGMDQVRDLVAKGGVSVVLAQDRDRFAREPAYHYLLRREFEEHGTKIRALNDRGDESPEGELTDGILDQLAKFERAKTAERTRRGKLRKAREGKVVAGPRPAYGFRYNDTRDNFVVDEETMRTIERIFRMVGAEGHTMHAVRLALNQEGIRSPLGGRFWTPKAIRDRISDDVYRPHTYDEVKELVSSEVASRLDPEKRYGIWWFNRRRYVTKQVAEVGPDGGRRYRRQTNLSEKPRSEWIAVPVPDSGIPREIVDAAREAIEKNTRPSANGERFWELSGGILYCAECGRRMTVHTTVEPKGRGRGRYFYYRCARGGRQYEERPCSHGKNHRAVETEAAVWRLVSRLLNDPERLKAGLEELIEQERAAMRGDPEQAVKMWLDKLAEVDQERRGYLRLAAKGHMSDEELGEALGELEDTRKTAERELRAIEGQREIIEQLKRDRGIILEHYAGMVPEALEKLTGEERRQVYGMLRLRVRLSADGSMEACGILRDNLHVLYENGQAIESNGVCENELASPSTISSKHAA
jgi:site-specific DNA recombinase